MAPKLRVTMTDFIVLLGGGYLGDDDLEEPTTDSSPD